MHARRRQWLHGLHQHLGLWVGVLFVLLGVTGSALTFYPEIDAFLNPSIRPTSQRVSPVSAQKVYEVLRHAYPDKAGSWRIEFPMAPDQAIVARYSQPTHTAHPPFAPLMVTLDPVTYQVTSARRWGSYPVTWIYDLHYTLLADAWGHNTVGAIGLLMLATLVLGWWLWAPPWGRIMHRMKPLIRPQPVKKVYDLHMVLGVYGGACLSIIALTGVILSYPQASQHLAASVLPFDKPMPSFKHLLNPDRPQAPLDRLMEKSLTVFPHAEVRWLETSGEDGREVTLRMFSGTEPSRRFPQTYVKLHPETGALLYQRHFDQLATGDQWWAWVHPLHNGEAFGLGGRMLVALLGLLPAALMITGCLRFMQKRKARALVQTKQSARVRRPT